ncbi:O-antigen ligase family protein [Deinococcus sp. KNUC1210]|uniref:O-antigen ligase family protein n=1 Tax=Deinococcus sp. KNUC1210 TaxID=2917691 RepID=UPI001EEFAB7F|nr:O-antigen ligase family protein [Deinococcus sp. KNUC1210]ULH15306.1 O-antigen ligase family protein [Deinococcus sp. KNUC1210]
MTRPADDPSFRPPKWVSWLIAGVPVFPPLYLAAFGSLKLLRTLPLTARWILFFFASTQLLSSLFTPQPLLSLGLNTARTLFILAMISAGVYLRDSRNLRPLLWGELIIFATAWGYTLYTQGFAGVQARLGHPYYYIVALGLIAVVALWIVVLWRGGSLWWRIPAGALAVATFIAAGSRGPLLALVVGSVAAAALRLSRRGFFIIAATLAALTLITVYGPLSHFKPAQRLLTDQTTGREFVWEDAYEAWQTSPIGGVGPYQGGPYLTYLFKDGCQVTPTLARNKVECPQWASRLYGVWLIAHNNVLHWLMETGLLGTLGLLAVYGYAIFLTVRNRDVFSAAILFGFTAIGTVDVVIAVPDTHFAEIWWVVVGMSFLPSRPVSGSSAE